MSPPSPPTPTQCLIILRQDLRPSDTILPLPSRQLLATLSPHTPSELQPIVIAPRLDSSGPNLQSETSAKEEITQGSAMLRSAYEKGANTNISRVTRSKAKVEMGTATAGAAGHAGAETTPEREKTREVEMETEVEMEPVPEPTKEMSLGDRIRRSRRQRTPRKY